MWVSMALWCGRSGGRRAVPSPGAAEWPHVPTGPWLLSLAMDHSIPHCVASWVSLTTVASWVTCLYLLFLLLSHTPCRQSRFPGLHSPPATCGWVASPLAAFQGIPEKQRAGCLVTTAAISITCCPARCCAQKSAAKQGPRKMWLLKGL